jgi:hypothetical protein
MTQTKPIFPDLHSILLSKIKEAVGDRPMSEADILKVIAGAVDHAVPEIAALLAASLESNAPGMLQEHRDYREGFTERNQLRWKEGLDVLETVIVISQEAADVVNAPGSGEQPIKDAKYTALTSLHARAVIVAREILWLMIGGFADGALGRWRTLHEVSVVAAFLATQDREISSRYLLRRNVESYKAAVQYRKYEQAANLAPFDDIEFAAIEKRKADIVSKYGEEMLEDWGWSSPVLRIKRPTFAAIEEYCGLDYWRPRYKWSSQDTHGNYRPHMTMLAMSEAERPTLHMAGSNSGMTDPAQMMSRSLVIATEALLQLGSKIESMITLRVLKAFDSKVGETFFNIQTKSAAELRKKQKGSGG